MEDMASMTPEQMADKAAEYAYGVYNREEEVPQDVGKAVEWYTRAFRCGYAAAGYFLGELYALGVDTSEGDCLLAPDEENSIVWYEAAAQKGHMRAQIECAEFYAKRCGRGRYQPEFERDPFDEDCQKTIC